jgi:hypothetical protein
MSLEHVIIDAALERGHYHTLASSEIRKLDDAEALFERGRRLRIGIGVAMDAEAGWTLNIESAKLGHAVALAFCFKEGRGTSKDHNCAFQLFRASAERGHPDGTAPYCLDSHETQRSCTWACTTRTGIRCLWKA